MQKRLAYSKHLNHIAELSSKFAKSMVKGNVNGVVKILKIIWLTVFYHSIMMH